MQNSRTESTKQSPLEQHSLLDFQLQMLLLIGQTQKGWVGSGAVEYLESERV